MSVIICSHNPQGDYLAETLVSLQRQEALPDGRSWELLIIDNASTTPIEGTTDISWHPDARFIVENKLGLTWARLRSFNEARGAILVYIDDDNVLDTDYLRLTLAAFEGDPKLGAVGGKSIPRWEVAPPLWFDKTGLSLACRDLGDLRLEAQWKDPEAKDRTYPFCAPIGAGMGIRRAAYSAYVNNATCDPLRLSLGRRGIDLASGEDNDMIMTVLSQEWKVAYLPELQLEHLIPARRISLQYLERYAESSSRTWVQVLAVHGICPWAPIAQWTLPLRKARAWLRLHAWAGPVERIKWCAACGTFDGRAFLTTMRARV